MVHLEETSTYPLMLKTNRELIEGGGKNPLPFETTIRHKLRHDKTIKHQQYINSLDK